VKDVQAISPRIKAGGVLQTGDDSTRVIINGIDPVHDSRIRHLEKRIIEGEYFTGDNAFLLVGSTLAHRIGITVDSEIVLNSIAADGQPVSVQCAVAGIFETGFSSYDSSMVFIPLSQVQSLLKIGAGEVTEIVVMADNPGKISEVADSMSSLLKERGYDHEVLHWKQLAPQLA
jgi:ABC-type lipoprotein release transport system permease subunit